MTKFETQRLVLRELTMDDLDALHEILSDPESMKHYPAPFDPEETKNWIAWNIDNYSRYGFGLWAVILKSENRFIGDCGITMQNINGSMEPEIGYHIHKSYCRKGYASEAARECIRYGFDTLGFETLYSYMKYTNIPSQKTAMKNGMSFAFEYEDKVNTITRVYTLSAENFKKSNAADSL